MSVENPTAAALEQVGEPEVGSSLIGGSGIRGFFARHSTLSYVLRRFALYLLTLWAAITATFFFFRLIPGNPIGAYIQNLQQNYDYNATASQQVINHYKAIFGLNGSLLTQYGHYLDQLVLHQNFGPSLINYPETAQSVISKSIPWTIGLLVIATVISWILGTIFGAIAGWRRSGKFSEASTWISVALAPVPFYFIGLVLVFLFAYRIPLFPAEAPYGVNVAPHFSLPFIVSIVEHGVMPALSIVIVTSLGHMLGMRQQMVTVLGEDYLTFARAKGLPSRRILGRYAMPNCYLPQITNLMISFGAIFGGNVLLEQLFSYPGVGYLLVKAIGQLDLNTVMGITDIAIFGVLTAVFVLDLIMPLLDPRIKYVR